MKISFKIKMLVMLLVGFSVNKMHAMSLWDQLCAEDLSAYNDPGYSKEDFYEKSGVLKNGHLKVLAFEIPADKIPKQSETDRVCAKSRAAAQALIAAACKSGISIPADIIAPFK